MLGCLCLAGGARVPRGRLAAMLWDRVPDFQGRASFRQAFRELIVAFGPLADDLISADRETIRLNTSLCWIDALAVLSTGAEKLAARRSRGALQGRAAGRARRPQRLVRSMAAERAHAFHRAAARAARRGAQAGRITDSSEAERARRHRAPSDPVRSDPRRRLAHPDARARRHGRARAGRARIRALPRGTEPCARCRAVAGNARAVRSDPHVFGARGSTAATRAARPAAAKRQRRAAGAAAQSRCASACCRFLRRQARRTRAVCAFAQPGDRRGARALPLVRRDRADGADAPHGPAPITDDPLRRNELTMWSTARFRAMASDTRSACACSI